MSASRRGRRKAGGSRKTSSGSRTSRPRDERGRFISRKEADRRIAGEKEAVRRRVEAPRERMRLYWDTVRTIQAAETESRIAERRTKYEREGIPRTDAEWLARRNVEPVTSSEARAIYRDGGRKVASGVYSRMREDAEARFLARYRFAVKKDGTLGKAYDKREKRWVTKEHVARSRAAYDREARIRAVQQLEGVSRKRAIEILQENRPATLAQGEPYTNAAFRAYYYERLSRK